MAELQNNSIDLDKKVLELNAVVNDLNDKVNKINEQNANNVDNVNNVNNTSKVGKKGEILSDLGNISFNTAHKGVDDLLKGRGIDFIVLQKGLLFFYLILLGNFTAELLGCKVQRFFDNKQIPKHIIGFISLYFFVFLADDKIVKLNPFSVLIVSVVMYLWFVLSAKMDDVIWFSTIVLLFLIAVLEVFNEHVKNKQTESSEVSISDKFILKYGSKLQRWFTYAIVILTIIGLLVYIGMKKLEYKEKWSWYKFFLGVPQCNNTLGSSRELEDFSIDKYLYFIKKAFNQ
jgi:hypothetical protein